MMLSMTQAAFGLVATFSALELAGAARLVPTGAKTKADVEPFGGSDASILQWPGDWGRNALTKPIHDHNG